MLKLERRYLDRIKIPGAEVEYKSKDGNTTKGELIDLTKISVKFYIDCELNEGDFIEIVIYVEDREEIHVKGNIVWIKIVNENNISRTVGVVQFLPFGSDERYNSLDCYEKLIKLEKDYSKDNLIRNHIYGV